VGPSLALAICGSVLGNRAARLSLLPVRVLVAALLPARMDTPTRFDLRILCLQLALSSRHLRRIRRGLGTGHRARPKGERRLAAMALFAFGIFIIEAGLYLFAPFDWIATIPVYYEIVVAVIYILAAVVGWCALVRFVIQWTLALISFAAGTRRSLLSRSGSGLSLTTFFATLVGLAILIWYDHAILPGTSHTHKLLGYFSEAWPDDHELVEYLRPRIALHEGASFRGSVLL